MMWKEKNGSEKKGITDKRVGKTGGPLRSQASLQVLKCSNCFTTLFGIIYPLRLILISTSL